LQAGVALTNNGLPIASMGADFRDFDNDGLCDLNVTALAGETFPLFKNLGKGSFQDVTHKTRLATLSTARSGWGNGLFDFNNDGWKDLFTANSDVNDLIDLFGSTHYKQPNSLFANLGDGSIRDGIGAKIRLGNQSNHVTTAVGYASSSPSTVHFGTGRLEKIDRVEIRWPSGTVQMLRNVATNQVLEVHEPAK